jgi:cell division protein FtsZ
VDTNLGDRIRVTVIATGFDSATKVASKKEEKKVHELDKSQIPLFGALDNSVNQSTNDVELKIKTSLPPVEEKKDYTFETPFVPITQPIEPKKAAPAEEDKIEKAYSFEWNTSNNKSRVQEENDHDEDMFNTQDEFDLGKGISAEEVINEDGIMEYRRTKDRLEEQAAARREKLKASKKGEMTKEEFAEKWTLPAYLRRGVKMDNVAHSSESFISRYNLNDDNSLLGNNKFLHDNVD